MSYKIVVEYRTGDSFHVEDVEDEVDFVWENLEIANENLQRIKKHYKLYLQLNDHWSPKKEKFNELKKKYGKEPWFAHKQEKGSLDEQYIAEKCVMLLDDDGNAFKYSCQWVGYFEHLYSARVELIGDNFEVDYNFGEEE